MARSDNVRNYVLFLSQNSEKEQTKVRESQKRHWLFCLGRRRYQATENVFCGTGGCSRNGSVTYASVFKRTRDATLIHTLNCVFLWLHKLFRVDFILQIDSKIIRGDG